MQTRAHAYIDLRFKVQFIHIYIYATSLRLMFYFNTLLRITSLCEVECVMLMIMKIYVMLILVSYLNDISFALLRPNLSDKRGKYLNRTCYFA